MCPNCKALGSTEAQHIEHPRHPRLTKKQKNRSGSRRWWNSARSCTWQLEGATPRWFGMRTRSIPKTAYNEKHLFFRFSPS